MEITKEINDKLVEWNALKHQLNMMSVRENELRREIVKSLFTAKPGTERLELGNGYTLKAVKKENFTLKNNNHETEIALANWDQLTRNTLVKWKPEISIAAYKNLTDDQRKHLLDTCLEIKPGMPELEIVAPAVVVEAAKNA